MDKRIEEIEILWKLDRRAEARPLLDQLLAEGYESPRFLELAAFIYLDDGQIRLVKEMIVRLEATGEAKEETIDRLKANVYLAEENWTEARPYYAKLYARAPNEFETAHTYAQILTLTREWKEAKRVYRNLRPEKNKAVEIGREYHRGVEELSHNAELFFQYWHRPNGQRDYKIAQRAEFWMAPWLRIGTSVGEDVYRRPIVGAQAAIRRFVMTHLVEAEGYYKKLFSFLMGWQSNYYNHSDYQELHWRAKMDTKWFRSRYEFIWNRLSYDPIESVEKQGRLHRYEMGHELNILDRIQVGHTFRTEWYRVPGANNQVNGQGDLGYDIGNDAYVNLVLWKRLPYLAMNYHFRRSNWYQPFVGANEVLGYLTEEKAHYGGFYVEHQIGKYFEFVGSVTRGNDYKRDVHYLYWYFEPRVWIKDFAKLSFSYEYDLGDSGTAGTGDSQIFTGKANIYF